MMTISRDTDMILIITSSILKYKDSISEELYAIMCLFGAAVGLIELLVIVMLLF